MAGELKKPIMKYLEVTQSSSIMQKSLNADSKLAIAKFYQHLTKAGDSTAGAMRAKWDEITQTYPEINPAISKNLMVMFAAAENAEKAARAREPQTSAPQASRTPVLRGDPMQDRASRKEMEQRGRNVDKIDAVVERFLNQESKSGLFITFTASDQKNIEDVKAMIKENKHGGKLQDNIREMKFDNKRLQGMLSEEARKMSQPKPKSFLQKVDSFFQKLTGKVKGAEETAPKEDKKRRLR